MVSLQDLSNLIGSLAALIGAITTFYQVVIKNKRDPPRSDTDIQLKVARKEIKELKRKLRENNHE